MFRWIAFGFDRGHIAAALAGKSLNIIYIMSDDHANARSALQLLNKPRLKTPNLDKLARTACATNSVVTIRSARRAAPACSPGSAATERRPLATLSTVRGTRHMMLGYQTAIIGNGIISTPTGPTTGTCRAGRYINPAAHRRQAEGVEENTGGYSEDVITDLSIDWLQNAPSTVHHPPTSRRAPYRTRRRPKNYRGTNPQTKRCLTITRAALNRSASSACAASFRNAIKINPDMGRDSCGSGRTGLSQAAHLSCVAAVDENIGRLLAYLQEAGLEEDTIIIYTSDQGFFLGEHGFYDKRLMYEPAITTPLIIHWPGHTKPGTVNTDMILNIDHAPTFLEVAGGKATKEMDGKSYKSILEGKTPPDWRKSTYYRYWMHLDGAHNVPAHYGVRTDRYTLIHYYGKGLNMAGAKNKDLDPEWELFDRQKDPQQMNNVYADKSYQATVRELRTELDRLRKEYGDDK